jgi:hypothetical protein
MNIYQTYYYNMLFFLFIQILNLLQTITACNELNQENNTYSYDYLEEIFEFDCYNST